MDLLPVGRGCEGGGKEEKHMIKEGGEHDGQKKDQSRSDELEIHRGPSPSWS